MSTHSDHLDVVEDTTSASVATSPTDASSANATSGTPTSEDSGTWASTSGERGATHLSDKVLQSVAKSAALSVPGVVAHGSGLSSLVGREYPRFDISTVEGPQADRLIKEAGTDHHTEGVVSIDAQIAVTWPCNVATVAANTQRAIAYWMRDMAGHEVVAVNVDVAAVVPAEHGNASAAGALLGDGTTTAELHPTPTPVVTTQIRPTSTPKILELEDLGLREVETHRTVADIASPTATPLQVSSVPTPEPLPVTSVSAPEPTPVASIQAPEPKPLLDITVERTTEVLSVSAPAGPEVRSISAPAPKELLEVPTPQRRELVDIHVTRTDEVIHPTARETVDVTSPAEPTGLPVEPVRAPNPPQLGKVKMPKPKQLYVIPTPPENALRRDVITPQGLPITIYPQVPGPKLKPITVNHEPLREIVVKKGAPSDG